MGSATEVRLFKWMIFIFVPVWEGNIIQDVGQNLRNKNKHHPVKKNKNRQWKLWIQMILQKENANVHKTLTHQCYLCWDGGNRCHHILNHLICCHAWMCYTYHAVMINHTIRSKHLKQKNSCIIVCRDKFQQMRIPVWIHYELVLHGFNPLHAMTEQETVCCSASTYYSAPQKKNNVHTNKSLYLRQWG